MVSIVWFMVVSTFVFAAGFAAAETGLVSRFGFAAAAGLAGALRAAGFFAAAFLAAGFLVVVVFAVAGLATARGFDGAFALAGVSFAFASVAASLSADAAFGADFSVEVVFASVMVIHLVSATASSQSQYKYAYAAHPSSDFCAAHNFLIPLSIYGFSTGLTGWQGYPAYDYSHETLCDLRDFDCGHARARSLGL
ncbi:MAG: hypothetical protein GYB36_06915 [Alphaproteobacteria bacterium]|nr:hypothetical protein [Alphaproteobacteria bacterium]